MQSEQTCVRINRYLYRIRSSLRGRRLHDCSNLNLSKSNVAEKFPFYKFQKEYLMRKFVYSIIVGLMVLTLVVGAAPRPALAASHREAPLIAMDPTADITDFFMFRSYEAGKADKIDLIMNVIPGEEPSAGPNYYNFDPNVLYAF